MLTNYRFAALSLEEQWPGMRDINLTFTIGHDGFPNLYVFAIGALGLIQIGIYQVSYKHARNLIGSHWFLRSLPHWLQHRLKQEMGFQFAYLGRFPNTVTFSKNNGLDSFMPSTAHVSYIDTNTL